MSFDAQLIAQMADAVIVVDNDLLVRFWNEAAAERYQISAGEALGNRLPDVIHYRFDSDEEENIAANAVATQGRWRGENTHFARDGREFRVESTVSVLRGNQGERTGLLAVIRDVTESRLSRTRLEAGERRLRGIFENAVTGIAISDRAGRLEECNQAFCALLGYSKEEIRGRPFSEMLHPEDRATNLALALRVLSGEIPFFEIENRYIHKSGKPIWTHKSISVAEEEGGRPAKLMALVTDVTDRRRREEDSGFLLRLDQTIAETSGAGELAGTALRLLGEYLAVDRCSFSEFDPVRDLAAVAHQWRSEGPPELTIYQLKDFYTPELLAAIKTGESIGIADVETDSRTAAFASRFAKQHFRALAQTAYLRDGKPVAILAAISSKPKSWERADLMLLREVVSRVWPAVERARVAEQLAQSEERLRLAAQVAGFGIRDFDVEIGRSFWSREMFEILGMEPHPDPNAGLLVEVAHPADRQRVAGRLADALDPGGPGEFDMEFRIVRANDGETRWVYEVSKTFFEGEPRKPVRSTGVMVDITSRKQTEQALAAAVQRLNAHIENSPLAIIHLDSEFRITRWSREAEALFGWTAAEVLGKGVEDFRFVYEQNLAQVRAFSRGHREGTQTRVSNVNRNYRKDGSLVECEWHSSTIYNRDGRLEAVLCQVLDLTEKRLTEKRLQEARKTESIAVLAGGIAHDFNNLLTGIIGNASLAREVLAAHDTAQTLLERLIRSANEAAKLTRQMLAYAGKGSFIVERISLPQIVREVSDLARATTPRTISIRLEIDSVATFVRADRAQIHQVVLNLVTNAAEAMHLESAPPSGSDPGNAILIRSGVKDLPASELALADIGEVPPGRYAFIEVSDTGCGMDEETRTRMFDPFFTTKFQGRGLGLAAVAGIVRAHGGALLVVSDTGRGTSVTALFPAEEPPA